MTRPVSQLSKDIEDARRGHSIQSVLGIPEYKNKIVCPFPDHPHSSMTPSFSIKDGEDGVQVFACHGACGRTGDVLDLVGYLYLSGYDKHNLKHRIDALHKLDQKYEWRMPERKAQAPKLKQNDWMQYQPISDEARRYARLRGLTETTIQKFHLGSYRHFLSIPIFEGGILNGIKFRNTWPECDGEDFDHLRFWMAKGSSKGLFNYDGVAYTSQPLLFLKGEVPTMLMDQYGFLACGLSTGEASLIEQWKPVLTFSKRVVVVGDNDKNPETDAKMKEKAAYRAQVVHGTLVFPPAIYKDLDEWVLDDPIDALPKIRRWLEVENG